MNRAVCITTWREFKANKVRVILLTLLFLGPIVMFTLQRCSSPEGLNRDLLSHPLMASFFTLLWASGVIGREVQNGTIALVLARPITIANYVISKWFAVGFAASLCALEAVFCEHIISAVNCPSLLWAPEVLANAFERVILCFGTAAFLVLLSSLVSGLKDLALLAGFGFAFVLYNAFASTVYGLAISRGHMIDSNFALHFGRLIENLFVAILFPYVPLSVFFSGNFFAYGPVISLVTLIACCLSISIWVLTHREFSYAAD